MNKTSILVAGAENLGHIAVIRSLGRAGYDVIACSNDAKALGFYSNYTQHALQHPDYQDSVAYIEWLHTTIKKYNIKAIIPSEAMLIAVKDQFDDYATLFPYSIPKDDIYNLFSKYYLFDFFIKTTPLPDLKNNLLPCYFIEKATTESEISTIVSKATYPLFLKADAIYQINQKEAVHSEVLRLNDPETAFAKIDLMRPKYKCILLQEYASGIGVGVFFLRWNDKIILHFMHQRIHEVPHTGGVSSYRRSWWHEKIYQDALNKVNALNYNGVIMFEYRWDKETDLFYLMEVNSRFWGSLHLALFSGVDFPKELLNCMLSETDCDSKTSIPFPINVRCRETFPYEIQYVSSIIKDSSLPIKIKIKSVVEFFFLMLNPKVHSDLFFKQDNYLYFRNMYRCVCKMFYFIKHPK